MDRSFKRQYSINVARMNPGHYEETFEVDDDFFAQMEGSLFEKGAAKVTLEMEKRVGYLNVWFAIQGGIEVACDRCGELYLQPIEGRNRLIYAFDPEMKFDNDEVVYVSAEESNLFVGQEMYDFISLAVPMRRVPPEEIHTCDPAVLALLGEGEETEDESSSEEAPIDERWAALQKLRDQMED